MEKWISILAAGLLATGTALADEHMMKSAGEHSKHFQMMDRDGDGYISQEEASAHRQLEQEWDKADADRDGRLDESEFSTWEADSPN